MRHMQTFHEEQAYAANVALQENAHIFHIRMQEMQERALITEQRLGFEKDREIQRLKEELLAQKAVGTQRQGNAETLPVSASSGGHTTKSIFSRPADLPPTFESNKPSLSLPEPRSWAPFVQRTHECQRLMRSIHSCRYHDKNYCFHITINLRRTTLVHLILLKKKVRI